MGWFDQTGAKTRGLLMALIKEPNIKNALNGLETTGPMCLIASFQYSPRDRLGLIVRIHDETYGILFHDFFDSIRWRYASETPAGSLVLVISGGSVFLFLLLLSV